MSTNSFVNVVDEKANVTQVRFDQFVAQLYPADTSQQMKKNTATNIRKEAEHVSFLIEDEANFQLPILRQRILESLGNLRFHMEACANIYGFSDQEILQTCANNHAKRYKELTYSPVAEIVRADKKFKPGPFDDLPDGHMFW